MTQEAMDFARSNYPDDPERAEAAIAEANLNRSKW